LNKKLKSFLTKLSPILGAGAVGVCPLCWIGSASLLSFLGLGALIPLWQWLVFVFLGLGFIGFVFDFKAHNNIYPILMYLIGGYLLYIGRYVYIAAGLGEWPIWGAGGVLILVAVTSNKWQFKRMKICPKHDHINKEKI